MPRVVLGVCDPQGTYCTKVAVAVISLLQHTSARVKIEILHDKTLSKKNMKLLEELCCLYGSLIDFHEVKIPSCLTKLHSLRYITVGTLFRLFIPSIFSQEDKIIYIDGDVFVQLDITSLWSIDMQGKSIAAVKDVPETRYRYFSNRYYRKFHIDPENYFNAGVLLLNCKQIQKKYNFPDVGIKILETYPHLIFADQDVLNIVFSKDIMILPNKYNIQAVFSNSPAEKRELIQQQGIIHFSGYIKPWGSADRFVCKKYLAYLAQTPWGKNIELLIDEASRIPEIYASRITVEDILLNRLNNLSLKNRLLCLLRAISPNWLYEREKTLLRKIKDKFLYNCLYRD